MTIRKVDNNGNDSFGHAMLDFEKDNALETVQLLRDNLKLQMGRWFVDLQQGTDYTLIMGAKNFPIVYQEIRRVMQGTKNVIGIVSFNPSFNSATRKLVINASVNVEGSNNLTQFTTEF